MTLTVITPTGARLTSFLRCVKMMDAQTYAGVTHWIIVDDGEEAMPTPSATWLNEVTHLRPRPYWQPGQNTLARNLLAALELVTTRDRLVIFEDDDMYAHWWLSTCADRLRDHDLIGESESLYFNVRTGHYREMGNRYHASLCSTALKGTAIEVLRRVCEADAAAIDVRLWREMPDNRKALYRPDPRGVMGIKGGPGRPGIGVGHHI